MNPATNPLERSARVFAALGDPERLRLWSLLCRRRARPHELMQLLGLSAPALSRRLRDLRLAGLVECTSAGRGLSYSGRTEPLRSAIPGASPSPENSCPALPLHESPLLLTFLDGGVGWRSLAAAGFCRLRYGQLCPEPLKFEVCGAEAGIVHLEIELELADLGLRNLHAWSTAYDAERSERRHLVILLSRQAERDFPQLPAFDRRWVVPFERPELESGDPARRIAAVRSVGARLREFTSGLWDQIRAAARRGGS